MESGMIISNTRLVNDYFKVTFYAPEICATARAGHFVHIKIAHADELVLRRPFSICNVSPSSGELEVIYKVVGSGTRVLSTLRPGEVCDLLGPLGKPFSRPADDEFPVAIAGGYGSAAMYMLTREAKIGGAALLGARNREDILLADAYRTAGFEVDVATDDGSAGHKGLVTDLVDDVLRRHAGQKLRFFACGPTPMLMAVCRLMLDRGYPDAEVSLDHLMCCGVGACFACVVKIKADNPDGYYYARTCSEGPVFKVKDVYLEK